MTISKEEGSRSKDGLKSLGKAADYPQNYTAEVLETFDNRHPQRDYWTLLGRQRPGAS